LVGFLSFRIFSKKEKKEKMENETKTIKEKNLGKNRTNKI